MWVESDATNMMILHSMKHGCRLNPTIYIYIYKAVQISLNLINAAIKNNPKTFAIMVKD